MLTEEDFQRLETFLKPTRLTCKPFFQLLDESIERYTDMKENGARPGVFTGYSQFDLDTGGLRRGALTVITAETGGCKSTFAANLMNYIAIEKKRPVAVFSFEMLDDEFLDIFQSMNAKVDRNKFNTGKFHDADMVHMKRVVEDKYDCPLYIFDAPATIEDVEEACIQLNSGVPLELVIVDYLQILDQSPGVVGNREQQVAHMARSLSTLANRLRCPVVALSQLNEEGQLRESRAIAHSARLVLKLEREGEEKLWLKITKGSRVIKKDYELEFFARFYSISTPVA